MTQSLTLYHGSMQSFDHFILDFLGQNGRAQGSGVYLSPDKQVAQMYATYHKEKGYVYTVNAQLKKALNTQKRTISPSLLSRILDALHQVPELELLSNFGDVNSVGYQAVKKEALDLLLENTNDLDLYNELVNISGDFNAVSTIFDTFGQFTHCVVENQTWRKSTVYVVLNPQNITILQKCKL